MSDEPHLPGRSGMTLSAAQYMALYAEIEAMRRALERIAAASDALAQPASVAMPQPTAPPCACPPGYESARRA
jgi:hypothetical protein